MFDQQELDELRSDREQWSDTSDGDASRHVSTRRFLGSMTTSVVVVAVLISMVVSMNLAVGVGIGQVGGFQAEFPELQGKTLNIYPAIGESSACFKNTTGTHGRPVSGSNEVGLPLLKADIKKANITTLPVALIKDIRIPDSIPPIDVIRVNLTQTGNLSGDQVTIGNASLHLTKLEAEEIVLSGGAQIRENYSEASNDPNYPIFGPDGKFKSRSNNYGEFSITGTEATMVNGTAQAHFLGFERLTMPNMSLKLEYNPDDPLNKTNNTCGPGLYSVA